MVDANNKEHNEENEELINKLCNRDVHCGQCDQTEKEGIWQNLVKDD